jgi:hypothetical protein
VLLTKLPKTDDIKEKVTKNCASLVTQSALKWENEGLLLQRGFGLSKRAMLRDVWATYVGCFDEAETAILGGISAGGLANDESSGRGAIAHEQAGSKRSVLLISSAEHAFDGKGQREVNTCLSQGITKKPRTNRQRARGRGVRGEVTQLSKTPRPDPDSWDCIIVGEFTLYLENPLLTLAEYSPSNRSRGEFSCRIRSCRMPIAAWPGCNRRPG